MKFPDTNLKWLQDSTIFLTRHGSFSYGTNIATSDEDYRGFCVPPTKYLFGFKERFEQAEFKQPDMVVYDIRKFFKLAADCNPSIIEVLFTDPSDHIIVTPLAKRILDNKELFLSKRAKHSFSGYAFAQLKKLHYGKEPTGLRNEVRTKMQADFGFDTKHAMHLVRLLRMGVEIMEGKGCIVKRPDAEELVSIRNGAWSYEQILEYTNQTEAKLNGLYETTELRHSPDFQKLDELCREIVKEFCGVTGADT